MSELADRPASLVPSHVAIIMDGNGRWAQAQGCLNRLLGHQAGFQAAKAVIAACLKQGVHVLTLFAFSSENWNRPVDEVNGLINVFIEALNLELHQLNQQGIRLRFIGDRNKFPLKLKGLIQEAEALTASNQAFQLVIAANYSGRWDLSQAMQALVHQIQLGSMKPEDLNEPRLRDHLTLKGLPDPDLLIRTGGEQRISNFLLWHLAYTELYFSPVFWPDFGEKELLDAFRIYSDRERRFGLTSAQIQKRCGHV